MGTVDERRRGIQVEHPPMNDPDETPGLIGTLVVQITEDLKAIGRDEIALVRAEIAQKVRATLLDTLVWILCGVIIAIGLAFLSVAAVDALAPLVPPLWARLLIGAGLYLAAGAALLFGYTGKLKRDMNPVPAKAVEQATKTVEAVKEELRHA